MRFKAACCTPALASSWTFENRVTAAKASPKDCVVLFRAVAVVKICSHVVAPDFCGVHNSIIFRIGGDFSQNCLIGDPIDGGNTHLRALRFQRDLFQHVLAGELFNSRQANLPILGLSGNLGQFRLIGGLFTVLTVGSQPHKTSGRRITALKMPLNRLPTRSPVGKSN